MAYYNEIDPFAAAWLRNLSDAGHIAAGRVDERSITDVEPSDLVGASQAHLFAGIGGWSYALRLAGVPDDAPIWTGSCPCQPFSHAGQGRGADDDRHLWPAFYRLIAERRPPVVFGEQVASGAGRRWLAAVRSDLEGLGYAVGAADLCAAGVGAPHKRQRLFWGAARVADNDSERRTLERIGGLLDGERAPRGDYPDRCGACGTRLGDTCHARPQGHGRPLGFDVPAGWPTATRHGPPPGGDDRWVRLADGSIRPVEPGTFPLAHGVPARVGRLRGYGNAIVPQVAAVFVRAFLGAATA